MRHEMRAEHEHEGEGEGRDEGPGGGGGAVRSWHMARDGEATAMCGRALAPGAKTLPDEEWGRTTEPCCHTCGALYLREVP